PCLPPASLDAALRSLHRSRAAGPLLVAGTPCGTCCFAPNIGSSLPFGNRAEGSEHLRAPQVQNFDLSQRFWCRGLWNNGFIEQIFGADEQVSGGGATN